MTHLMQFRFSERLEQTPTNVLWKPWEQTVLFRSSLHLGQYRLRDFTNPELVSDREILAFLEKLDRKLSRLEAIFNTQVYEASFRSGGETFFWIEEDLLP